jgi:hypothetical protein
MRPRKRQAFRLAKSKQHSETPSNALYLSGKYPDFGKPSGEIRQNKPELQRGTTFNPLGKPLLPKNVLAESCLSDYYPINPGNPEQKLASA